MNTPEQIQIQVMCAAAFAPFGDLLDVAGNPDKIINQGLCGRYHDRAQMEFCDGRAGLSLFNAEPRDLPMPLAMMERHPEGRRQAVRKWRWFRRPRGVCHRFLEL